MAVAMAMTEDDDNKDCGCDDQTMMMKIEAAGLMNHEIDDEEGDDDPDAPALSVLRLDECSRRLLITTPPAPRP